MFFSHQPSRMQFWHFNGKIVQQQVRKKRTLTVPRSLFLTADLRYELANLRGAPLRFARDRS